MSETQKEIIWKPINHKLVCHYSISNEGLVRNQKNQIVQPEIRNGMHKVILNDINTTGKRKKNGYYIHDLLSATFTIDESVSPNEVWRIIIHEDLPHTYEVSNIGRYRKQSGDILSAIVCDKYLIAFFCLDLKTIKIPIHVLVASAFVEKLSSDRVVIHIDGNKLNNRSTNLEWIIQNNEIPQQSSNRCEYSVTRIDHNGIRTDYESLILASRDNGVSIGSLKRCLNGKQTSHKGFRWEYSG